MKYIFINKLQGKISFLILIAFILFSCEGYLEIDPPKAKIDNGVVFSNDETATSALLGIYEGLINAGFASGNYNAAPVLSSLSADELRDYTDEVDFATFELNSISPANSNIHLFWKSAYTAIYRANSAIEGLNASNGLTVAVKNQLLGESHFIRSFTYFNLINFFGDVPLILTTDYQENSSISRTSTDEVYDAIIEDLIKAQELLIDEYPTYDRVRPNKTTAQALLARVYLFRENWAGAEEQATSVIDNSNYYLEFDLNSVFLTYSGEAIWQLMPVVPGNNTNEAKTFIVISYPQNCVLTDELVAAFEVGDARLDNWIGSEDIGSEIVFFPLKYKIRDYDPDLNPPQEYSMVFRLAEQYLIRAEARAQQNDLAGAISDLDIIRSRAGLPLINDTNPGIIQADLLLAIEHERQVELFTEWGHRWFDLKRTNRANAVLDPIKADWQPEDVLYPIPADEFEKNPQLGLQNPGY